MNKSISIILIVLFALLTVGYCIAMPFLTASIAPKDDSVKVVVVDAGHGGADGGVVGKSTGIEEKTLNLIVANYLGEMLRACGIDVVYTRRNDTMYAFEGVTDNNKRADMFKRGEIINNAAADAVVSIHMNYYSLPTRRGAQVFYSKSSTQGAALAKCVQQALNEKINTVEGGREYSALCAQKYILECSESASIIVECGFLSSYADEQSLLKPAYRQRVAAAICQAVCEFLC